ncbi:carotenoid oxygenase family protein [Sorangium sp. So ce861]|uniref:carotenoid oxygenase family protein n=1 Tax=Sorangium sp. So ce861 TaxID=3133323 RepID=UPI003F5D6689
MTGPSSPEPPPFHLTGNFAPVPDEITVHDLDVTGTLPPELAGTYVRNGPNPRNGPSPTWFLGQECVFVPRTPGSDEDDGYAICYVYDRHRNASDLVVLDAADFAAPALATVALPRRVPFGIHGSWFPDLG